MQPVLLTRMPDRFSGHERSDDAGSGKCNDVDLGMNPKQPRIRTEVQVMFFDTDCGGVVSNIAYLRFIEIARTQLAEELGLHLAQMTKTNQYPVVVRTEIDYRRAAKLADRLVIDGWLDQLERARFWCAFRIVRSDDG